MGLLTDRINHVISAIRNIEDNCHAIGTNPEDNKERDDLLVQLGYLEDERDREERKAEVTEK